MRPLRVHIVSPALIPMGGASKEAGLLFRHLDRRLFDPHVLASCDMTAFALEWGIPADRYGTCDMSDARAVASALAGCDVALVLTASADTRNEYSHVWAGAPGLRLRVLRCVFGLGAASPDKADLFLAYSKESWGAGSPCGGCHVVYPPVPRHEADAPRDRFRRELGIRDDAFVVGYASADQRPEFFEAAAAFTGRRDVVFLSALSRPAAGEVPPNVLFCGTLSQRRMASLYDACEMVLHARTESFGYSVHQGIAAGKPVVAIWTGSRNGFSETMYPGGGYLARDAAGAASAVEHVIRNRDEAAARARTALSRVVRLVPELQVPRFEALMLRAMGEQGTLPQGFPDPAGLPGHWPDADEVSRWPAVRAEIRDALSRGPFV